MEEIFAILERYNFWNGTAPDTGFQRRTYTDKLIRYTGNRLVKVLTGQRRTGKSYIMRQIALKLIETGVNSANIFYINKEFTGFDFLTDHTRLEELLNLYRERLKPEGKIWLFIDEIQDIPGWEHFVNSYSQDYTIDCEIFISGSNSNMLSGELATLLSGRYVKFTIFPFSFEEYAGITGKEMNRSAYLEYMESGGLPELFNLPDEETKRNYVSAVKDTVLLRDIIQRHKINDPKLLEDIFIYLVNNASNLFSVNNLANYFKTGNRRTSYDTVSNYAGFIEDAWLVHKCERYDIRGRDTISGNCKYYINDLAYKNYLYSGFGYGLGYKLENLLYLELRRAGFDIYTGALRDGEIDFVAINGERTIYLQCAYLLSDEQTYNREYSPFEKINDHYEKYVVSLDELTLPSDRGIRHIQAWNLSSILF
jgi:hypothetical protein